MRSSAYEARAARLPELDDIRALDAQLSAIEAEAEGEARLSYEHFQLARHAQWRRAARADAADAERPAAGRWSARCDTTRAADGARGGASSERPLSAQLLRQLSPCSFLRFGRDAHGRVLASALRERVYDGAFVAKLRAWLHCYDRDGRGSLSEADLERYVGETMPALQNIDAKFCPFYVCTAVRRVVFFVEQKRAGPGASRVSIAKLCRSRVCNELIEVGRAGQLRPPPGRAAPAPRGAAPGVASSTTAAAASRTAPVLGEAARSTPTPARCRSGPRRGQEHQLVRRAQRQAHLLEYLNLDTDHNGMLSRRELRAYRGGTLTATFVDRAEEAITYRCEDHARASAEPGELAMDYKTWLDFVLAMENKKTPEAFRYFWRLLDVQKCGFLQLWTINYFYRDIAARLRELGHDAPAIDDVNSEIFDMVKPRNAMRITYDDLLECEQRHTIIRCPGRALSERGEGAGKRNGRRLVSYCATARLPFQPAIM